MDKERQERLDKLPAVIEGAHGTGGKMTHALIENVFVPLFQNRALQELNDQAIVASPTSGRLALSTDSFVVKPYRFPGGNIGDLAVNGTVNDLLMGGATPKYLTASFILIEGLPMADLLEVAESMADAAKSAGVELVAGDTKVVEGSSGDGLFITTTGVGFVPDHVHWGPDKIQVGDVIILSGTIADHGASVMVERFGMAFDSEIVSDTANLRDVVMNVRDLPGIRCMRDPTRGGLATTLSELSAASHLTLRIEESSLPIREDVRGICEILGLDPLYVANEGKLVAVVAPEVAEEVVRRMRSVPESKEACIIGSVTDEIAGYAALTTLLGARRLLELLTVEQLPRIC